MKKKYVTFLILAIALGASGVGNFSLANQLGIVELVPPTQAQDLVYGTNRNIVDLDPHYAYDSASIAVIDQVVERLYWFNISDPACPPVPALATDYPTISPNGLEYTIPLRQGVKFHDGTDFNASVVKWNFDRLAYFMNFSSNAYLPAPFNVELPIAVLPTQLGGPVYSRANGQPFINRTEVVDTNTVKFVLNEPKTAFVSILAFSGSGIMSPASTPPLDYYDLTDTLVGTGPFIYKSFITDYEITFDPNPEYWQGPTKLDSLTFVIFPSLFTLNMAFLAGDIDILTAIDSTVIDLMDADPDIDLNLAGNTFNTAWITFNYEKIPLAMRKAISYALNYSYIIDVVYDGRALDWPTYIPMGIAYANYSLNAPTFDVEAARDFLLNDGTYGPIANGMGLRFNTNNASNNALWTSVANGANGGPIQYYNYTWNIGNTPRQDTGNRLSFDLENLGIELEVFGVAWSDLLDAMVLYRDDLDLYMMGWGPDYIDPENYISALWSNISAINGGNYYEPDVQALMDAGLTETDTVVRQQIYDDIQRLMVERDYPGMPLLTGINYDAWKNEVVGFSSNPLGNVWFYPVYIAGILPTIFIDSPTTNQFFGSIAPDYNVEIYAQNLDTFWYTMDEGATNYTFTATIGTFNQTAWNTLDSGTVIIGFYANNTNGDIQYATVSVIKDIDAPTSDLLFIPHSGINVVIKSTTFILSADDSLGSGVSVIKYKINDSAWINYSGQFDLSSYEYGDYLISHQAIDVVGNIEVVKTVLVTLVEIPSEIPSEEPSIPGYNIILLIGIICFVSMIFYKKRHNIIYK
ncbi:hypothetical protein LCGC14_0883340 [marine sediment metagenome]|uniref:Solute-binding protein family 5 domain-containing protein n=1 Tax=marine sediment metagenome TaxID=412755 RepID=A0A0F9RKR3_9ZZZZ|nr:hypothetical protein [bacterium]